MASTALFLALCLVAADRPDTEQLRIKDERLTIELFANAPDIVTPTGITIEPDGRVLAIESHTHFRPEGYRGPAADRIRAFEDTNGDGKADRITTVFEGTTWTMGLGVHPSGVLYVATRNEVFRLVRAPDGSYGQRTEITRLETSGRYPHNGLSGFTFDDLGNVYFGLGENLGERYALVGSDGTSLEGGGEGGNIYRCDPNGKSLTRVATGFWNPFHLAFDSFGRLFAVDNDPDSRPPCRLLHVVDEGDYGYRFRNGRRGLHPFTAWNGELPGTLPMVAGTGEAPSGIVAYESDNLPDEYRGTLLVTSWGDHRIDQFRLLPRGASFQSTSEPVVTGGENFRPVGIVQAPDGSLFVSDWVDKAYELHGKGRIWHLRAKQPPTRSVPDDDRAALAHPDQSIREVAARRLAAQGEAGFEQLSAAAREARHPRTRAVALLALLRAGDVNETVATRALRDDSEAIRALAVRRLPAKLMDPAALAASDQSPAVQAEALRRITKGSGRGSLLEALKSLDPFVTLAARIGLKRSTNLDELVSLATNGAPEQRLAALIILRESPDPEARKPLPALLADPDPVIRQAAVQWVAEQHLTELRPQVASILESGTITRSLFEAALAALERLDSQTSNAGQESSGEEFVVRLLLDPKTSLAVRRLALRTLRPDHPELTLDRLRPLVESVDSELATEAVRSLRESPREAHLRLLGEIAARDSAPVPLRAEAIVGLPEGSETERTWLVKLAADAEEPGVLRREALRSLQATALSPEQKLALWNAGRTEPTLAALAARAVGEPFETLDIRGDVAAWLAQLQGPADPAEGSRIFYHPKGAGCYRCHGFNGRGGSIGPELSTTGGTLTRARLIESIVQPAREVAPQFVPWTIANVDGTVRTGLLVREHVDGSQTYADSKGALFTLKPSDIEERRPATGTIMPDGLTKTLTLQELRDLLAFLQKPPGS